MSPDVCHFPVLRHRLVIGFTRASEALYGLLSMFDGGYLFIFF